MRIGINLLLISIFLLIKTIDCSKDLLPPGSNSGNQEIKIKGKNYIYSKNGENQATGGLSGLWAPIAKAEFRKLPLSTTPGHPKKEKQNYIISTATSYSVTKSCDKFSTTTAS